MHMHLVSIAYAKLPTKIMIPFWPVSRFRISIIILLVVCRGQTARLGGEELPGMSVNMLRDAGTKSDSPDARDGLRTRGMMSNVG